MAVHLFVGLGRPSLCVVFKHIFALFFAPIARRQARILLLLFVTNMHERCNFQEDLPKLCVTGMHGLVILLLYLVPLLDDLLSSIWGQKNFAYGVQFMAIL